MGIFNTVLEVSLHRCSYSNIFCIKYALFYCFSTKRVDHSNTRLASQLDRNPGSSPSWILELVWRFFGGWIFCRGGGIVWEVG